MRWDPKQVHLQGSLVVHPEDWKWLGSTTLIWCPGRSLRNSLPSDVTGVELLIQRGTGTKKSWVSSQLMPLSLQKSNSRCMFETQASPRDGTGPLSRGKIILSASTSLTPPPCISSQGYGQAGLWAGWHDRFGNSRLILFRFKMIHHLFEQPPFPDSGVAITSKASQLPPQALCS